MTAVKHRLRTADRRALYPFGLQGAGARSRAFSGDRVRSTRRKALDGAEALPCSGRVPGPERGRAQRRLSSCPGTLPVGETRGCGGKATALRGAHTANSAVLQLQRNTKFYTTNAGVGGFSSRIHTGFENLNNLNSTASSGSFGLCRRNGDIKVNDSGKPSALVPAQTVSDRGGEKQAVLRPYRWVLTSIQMRRGRRSSFIALSRELAHSFRNLRERVRHKFLHGRHYLSLPLIGGHGR